MRYLLLLTCLLFSSTVFAQTPQNYVTSFKEVREATFNLVCRSKVSKKNMGGGSGSAIYQTDKGFVLLVTALHVTQGCSDINGVLYLQTDNKVMDLLGNEYEEEALYIPLVEIAIDRQHDISLIGTTKKMASGQEVYKIMQRDLDFAERIYTAGFPGVFRVPPSIMITEGIVNNPHAKVEVCAMTEKNLRRAEIRRGFLGDILGVPTQSLGVWDCDPRHGMDSTLIDIVVHDADIGPGNSGGTLFNAQFELAGVTVVGYKLMNWRPGSIPISYVRDLLMTTPYGESVLNNG